MNIAGAAVILVTAFIVSTYLVSTFTLQKLEDWFAPLIMVFGAWPPTGVHGRLTVARPRAKKPKPARGEV